MKRIILFYFISISFWSNKTIAQQYEWEFDKAKEKEQINKVKHDSLMNHLKGKWALSINYGRWNFMKSARSNNSEEVFYLPNMGRWDLNLEWHFHEKLVLDILVGFQKKKDVPATPNLFSIISGEEIEIEGSGGGFVPIEVGFKYYFLIKKIRPYIHISGGYVSGKSQYTEASGNVYDGIIRNNYTFNSQALLLGTSSGLDYRWSRNVKVGLDISYKTSTKFNDTIGGYTRYNGILVSGKIAVMF